MKTLMTLLVTLAMFAFTNATAEKLQEVEKKVILDTSTEYKTVKVATPVPLGLKQAVIDKLAYPKHAQRRNLEGQVYMRLCMCTDNTVKVIGLSATNQYLGDYVKKELSNMYVEKPGCKSGQVYLLKVNFDLLF